MPASNDTTEENPLAAQQSRPLQGRTVTQRRALSAAGLALTALVVAACGGGSSAGSSAGSAPGSSSSGPDGQQFAANFGAVSGKVVSINSAGASVQSASGTTTVAWATSTRFSKVSAVSLSSLAKGDCVAVMSARTSAGGSATSITATSVSVTSTTGCAQRSGGLGGLGGGNGTPPSGGPSNGGNPGEGGSGTTSPRPFPSGSPGFGGGRGGLGGGRGFGGAFGTITSISKSSFVLTSQFGSRPVTVKTTPATVFSATSSATSAALVTGTCAAAIGSKASSGAIDARSITISAPQNGKCPATSAFPGGRDFGGGFGRGGQGFGSSPPVTSA